MFTGEKHLSESLNTRKEKGLLRELSLKAGLIDFCSNDYLGFSRLNELLERINSFSHPLYKEAVGSTGSRLLAGNSDFTEFVEKFLADFYKSESALIFNSGYDANVGLFSSVPQRGDTILFDELIHASIRDGIRLSNSKSFSFKHNDLDSLSSKLKHSEGNAFVAVESVYSMDGDFAPLSELAAMASEYNFNLIIDEAHASGLFGNRGEGKCVELDIADKVFARIHTFGKALGCHGACIVGSDLLRTYLVNYARSFIYTTALSPHAIKTIYSSHQLLLENNEVINKLKGVITYFKMKAKDLENTTLIPSDTAIQCFVIPGNSSVRKFSNSLQNSGFDVRPILSPTVPEGSERIRICLHSFNTKEDIDNLLNEISTFNC